MKNTETHPLRREQEKCLHCQGNHDSAGHKGLRGDVATIKKQSSTVTNSDNVLKSRNKRLKCQRVRDSRLDKSTFIRRLLSLFNGKSVKIDSAQWCKGTFYIQQY